MGIGLTFDCTTSGYDKWLCKWQTAMQVADRQLLCKWQTGNSDALATSGTGQVADRQLRCPCG